MHRPSKGPAQARKRGWPQRDAGAAKLGAWATQARHSDLLIPLAVIFYLGLASHWPRVFIPWHWGKGDRQWEEHERHERIKQEVYGDTLRGIPGRE